MSEEKVLPGVFIDLSSFTTFCKNVKSFNEVIEKFKDRGEITIFTSGPIAEAKVALSWLTELDYKIVSTYGLHRKKVDVYVSHAGPERYDVSCNLFQKVKLLTESVVKDYGSHEKEGSS